MHSPSGLLRLHPSLCNRQGEIKKQNDPNERTDQNSRKELSNREIANLSDADFKTLEIRVLTKMIEYGCQIKEEVKAIQSEIKKNIQEPTVKGRKSRLKSMIWNKR